MIKIDLQNIQAIGTAEVVIEENTITVFSGDNSNGKSILSKVIQSVTSGDIKNKEIRRSLIKDGTDTGIISFTKGKQQLAYILKEEVSQSFVIYSDDVSDEKNRIVRNLNDKTGLEQLNKKFGFRTYADGDICLQLSPTFGAIPFVTTSGKVNADIVQDITVDKIAQSFLDSFKTITFPTFRQRLQNLNKEKEHLEQMLSVIEDYDWREYERIANDMQEVVNVLRNYRFVKVQDIPVPPNVKLYYVEKRNVRDITKSTLYQPIPFVKDIPGLDEITSMRKGVCPTCGRAMVEQEHIC